MKKENVDNDIKNYKLVQESSSVIQKYNQLMNKYISLEKNFNAILKISDNTDDVVIRPCYKDNIDESVAFAVTSDWHVEERVDKESINFLNEYNLDIARFRITRFYQNTLKLVRILSVDTKIKTLVIPHIGDLISGNIHEELLENCLLRPIDATIMAKQLIKSGLDMILNNSKLNLIIPCSCGNHSRISKKIHFATESGNSLEYFLFKVLESEYTGNSRIKFIINRSYHTYMTVFNKIIRLHHGHQIRYNGGVGGIYIPVNKAIAQWNKGKKADYDVIGHFHQRRDGGNFICNGSIIGHNSFALSIKADYEEPQQTFFLIHKTKGKTIVAPILLN